MSCYEETGRPLNSRSAAWFFPPFLRSFPPPGRREMESRERCRNFSNSEDWNAFSREEQDEGEYDPATTVGFKKLVHRGTESASTTIKGRCCGEGGGRDKREESKEKEECCGCRSGLGVGVRCLINATANRRCSLNLPKEKQEVVSRRRLLPIWENQPAIHPAAANTGTRNRQGCGTKSSTAERMEQI